MAAVHSDNEVELVNDHRDELAKLATPMAAQLPKKGSRPVPGWGKLARIPQPHLAAAMDKALGFAHTALEPHESRGSLSWFRAYFS